MKKYEIFTALSILFCCLFSTTGCKLDVTPTDDYTDKVIWEDPDNIELYMNDLYSTFRTFQFGSMSNFIGDGNCTDALTDLVKYTSVTPGKGTVNEISTNPSIVSSANPIMNYWSEGYERIRRINEFLYGLNNNAKGLTIEQKNQYQAEARFIRGYVFFWLAKLHGSFVILTDINDYKNRDRQRSSEDECWNAVAADFKFASENLPITWNAKYKGKATKIAAYGMLARCWLYAASVAKYDKKQFNSDPLTGISESKAKEYFENAANAAKQAIEIAPSSGVSLESNFENAFKKESKEIVFASYYSSPTVKNAFDIMYAPPGDDKNNKCWVRGVPTAELVDEFELANGKKFDWNNAEMQQNPYANRGARFYASILYNGSVWKGRTINTIAGTEPEGYVEYGNNSNADEPKKTVTGYYFKKMLDQSNLTFVDNGSYQPSIEMRYSEILLIGAEAEALLDGASHNTLAKEYINSLREKRGLPEFAGQNLMEAIKHERIVELGFEGHRYWDLRRWREAHIKLNDIRFHACKITSSSSGNFDYERVACDDRNRKFNSNLYYLPIPSYEIRNNQKITQIQGW